jgi:hypothetical protein
MADVSQNERAFVLPDWPQPAVVSEPKIFADDTTLSVRYRTQEEQVAVIRFPLCKYFVFGAPNDEALGGHPLAKCGLSFYKVHEVHNSSLVLLLERRNSVHPSHDRDRYLNGVKHYIFTFQDSTLECVVNEGEWWKSAISIFDREETADQFWRTTIDG